MEIATNVEGARRYRSLLADGKKVSWLTVIDHRMRIGSAVVRMGGIAGVGTEPAERMKGYCRRLMEDSIAYMRDEGFDVSLLFGIPDFYPRFGYAVCGRASVVTMATRDAERAGSSLGPFEIRPYSGDDLDSLIDLYNQANHSRTGTVVRERPQFEGIRKGSRWGTDAEVIVLVDKAGRFAGYAAFDKNDVDLIVTEVEAVDPAAFPNVLYEFARLAIERRTGSIAMYLPPDHPFAEFCHRYECKVTLEYRRCGGAMMRIISQDSLFGKISGELAARIADSRFARDSVRLGLHTDLGDTCLEIEAGNVTPRPGTSAGDYIELPQSRLAQLVMGYRSARDLMTEPDVSFHGNALSLAEVLFPKQNAYVWAADHF
ncbi:MAG: GNAT family N-acetyltransferase [Armatimonadota bacterium]